MVSSYSTDLKLELMVTGENAGTWGDKTNTNLNLIQQAIAGYEGVSIAGGAGTTALTMDNAALSNARNMVIEFTGAITGNRIVTIPNGIEKNYILKNSTTGAFTVTFKYASTGTGILLTQNYLTACYADGTDIRAVNLTTLSGTISNAQIPNLSVTTAKLNSFAVTTVKINSLAVTSAKLATNAVTAVKITQSTITQSKLAANSVGADQLISTGVTAGSYTASNITVDADGRITVASSGSASAGMEIPTLFQTGPATGTFTAQPATSELIAYSYGGGPAGGFGAYKINVTQPYSQPYSVGGPGSATRLGPSPAPVLITNGGPAGTAPGATFTYPNRSFIAGENYGSDPAAGALIIFENSGT